MSATPTQSEFQTDPPDPSVYPQLIPNPKTEILDLASALLNWTAAGLWLWLWWARRSESLPIVFAHCLVASGSFLAFLISGAQRWSDYTKPPPLP